MPNGEFGRHVQLRGWVPDDDEHTMYCVLWWKRGVSAMTQQAPVFKDGAPIGGMGRRNDFLPNTADWLGRWRLAANASNDWHIDRAGEKTSGAAPAHADGVAARKRDVHSESDGLNESHPGSHENRSPLLTDQRRPRRFMQLWKRY